MKYNVLFEKCFTYEIEVEAENTEEANKKSNEEFNKLINAEKGRDEKPFLDKCQEGRWEQVDINETED